MADGSVTFDGMPRDLAELARGKVWLTGSRHPAARLSWRTGEGRYRNIGDAPADAQPVEPTIEDGYLLLLGEQALEAVT